MRMLKATSSKWINDNKFIKDNKFQWQNAPLNDAVGQGYGAFSYSRSQRNNVINYHESGGTSQGKNIPGGVLNYVEKV